MVRERGHHTGVKKAWTLESGRSRAECRNNHSVVACLIYLDLDLQLHENIVSSNEGVNTVPLLAHDI